MHEHRQITWSVKFNQTRKGLAVELLKTTMGFQLGIPRFQITFRSARLIRESTSFVGFLAFLLELEEIIKKSIFI